MKSIKLFVIAFSIVTIIGIILVFPYLESDCIKTIEILVLVVLISVFIAILSLEIILMCYGTGYQLSAMLINFIAAGLFSSFCCRMMTLALFSSTEQLLPYDVLFKWFMQVLTFVGPLTIITSFPIVMLNYKNGWTDEW